MKKSLFTALLLCVLISFCACSGLSNAISGDIIDSVGDFSQGNDEGTLIFGGNNYILIDEFNGDFVVDITEDDIFLGQTSNFPVFPNYGYYANAEKNADYIVGGSLTVQRATFVYLREDLYTPSLCYVLENADYEFDFSSAFIKTEEVSYEKHIEGKKFHSARIRFYVKDYPRLAISLQICEFNGKWYFIEPDDAFVLSKDFLNVLMENNLL